MNTGLPVAALVGLLAVQLVAFLAALALPRRRRELLLLPAVLGALFQLAHFSEHAAQLEQWVAHPGAPAWLSSWAGTLASGFGVGGRLPMGVELLHLAGNLIFLLGVLSLALLAGEPRAARWLRTGTAVQTMHVGEHLLLTATLALTGTPSGISTLFGALSGPNLVANRVVWHIVVNLIGTIYLTAGLACLLMPPLPTQDGWTGSCDRHVKSVEVPRIRTHDLRQHPRHAAPSGGRLAEGGQ